jgi:hypothetical protein
MGNIQNREIELDRAILIDSRHSGRARCDIGGNKIELCDSEMLNEGNDLLSIEDICLKE